MADRPEPYVKRAAGDVIRADHWNEAQVRAREDIGAHDHTGGLGAPIPREGILEKAIDGTRIDPNARVTVQDLEVRGELKVSAGPKLNSSMASARRISGSASVRRLVS